MRRLIVTLGDPAGIGPEVVQKSLLTLKDRESWAATLVGPENIATAIALAVGGSCQVEAVRAYEGAVGRPSAEAGATALESLLRGIDLIKQKRGDVLVTAPISKEALALAGCAERGHTEILARHLGVGPVAMSFFSKKLKVVLATTHVPFSLVPGLLTVDRIVAVASLLAHALAAHLNIANPKLALAGLNPHAGERGLIGQEELTVLAPAVEVARKNGLDLRGPYPADSLFFRALRGEFDGVVALYHDQGLIPVKLLSFGEAVNFTLGLSVPRVSPDHGTAFDIAGQNSANPAGMTAALQLALEV